MRGPQPRTHPFDALVDVMAALRDPESGCPWDREQTLGTLNAYAVEEVYELVDAIDGGDPAAHREELGDVLLQVIFQARIRDEEGAFDAHDVCRGITDKLLRRHPHVFGDESVSTAQESRSTWERMKAGERAACGGPSSALDGVPRSSPSLLRTSRLGERAAAVGFDWSGAQRVWGSVDEELAELREAIEGGDHERIAAELGDALMALANLGRHLGVEPEDALRGANDRFAGRFRWMEQHAPAPLRDLDDDALDALWRRAKADLG